MKLNFWLLYSLIAVNLANATQASPACEVKPTPSICALNTERGSKKCQGRFFCPTIDIVSAELIKSTIYKLTVHYTSDVGNSNSDLTGLKYMGVCLTPDNCSNGDSYVIWDPQNNVKVINSIKDFTVTFYMNVAVSNGVACTPNFQIQWDFSHDHTLINSNVLLAS
ncbi:unnamed protein product [[Candida] boidinii]|nr:unnamed protein product [[Candida] boidinii]